MVIKLISQIIRSASRLIDELLDTYGGNRKGNHCDGSSYGGVHHGRRAA